MKKIFFLLVAICTFFACDPVQEDISMGSHITVDELMSMVTVNMDKAASGKNGNVILCTCSTSAPVSVGWHIDDKDYAGRNVSKKVKLGDHKVTLTAICGDGTKYVQEFTVNAEEITQPLEKHYFYGDPEKPEQKPFVLASGDAGAGRFSDNEGKYLPYLPNDVYSGKKTLIFDIIEVQPGPFIWGDGVTDVGVTMRVMNGWWSATYKDNEPISVGLWELPLTDEIANDCARNAGSKDLDLLMTRGSITIKSVYYEE